jgi:putative acetyltransferase
MVGDIQIRLATPEDAEAISRVLFDAFIEFKPLYTPKGFSATAISAEQVLARMREGPTWLAVRGGELLGTVAAVVKNESLYMRGMAVLPIARGSGVGTRLVMQVEHFAGEHGCRLVFLSTTPFLDAAIRLYQKHGFLRRKEEPQDLFGTPLFTMEKFLSHE